MSWEKLKVNIYDQYKVMDHLFHRAAKAGVFKSGFAVLSGDGPEGDHTHVFFYLSPLATEQARDLPPELAERQGFVDVPPPEDLGVLLGIQGDDHPSVRPFLDAMWKRINARWDEIDV